MDPLARLRTFPKAPSPNDDASAIRGNPTLDQKQLNANILAYHVAAGTKVFGNSVLNDLKMVEVNVKPVDKRAGGGVSQAQAEDELEGEMICEIHVSEGEHTYDNGSTRPTNRVPRVGMLNVYGTVAGPCFAAICDL